MEFDVITGKPYYQVELTFSVINATPLVLLQQRVGLYGLVYYENQEILSIMLPTNSLALKKGVNTNKKVQIKTNPDKMDALMEFIGRYSEGESIQVNLKGIKAVYTGDDGRKIGWIDDILDELSFNITVPAGSEEMIGSESKYSPLAI